MPPEKAFHVCIPIVRQSAAPRKTGRLYINSPKDSGRHAADNGIGRHIFGNDGTRSYHCIIPDGDALQYRCIRADPDVAPQNDGGRCHGKTLLRSQPVIERCKNDGMTDETVVPDGNTALILKMATGVDENAAT